MRVTSVAILLCLMLPGAAAAQVISDDAGRAGRWSVSAGGGPTMAGGGYDLSVAIGFAPLSRLELRVGAERLHLPFEERVHEDGAIGWTRGGTMTFVTGEVRASLFPRDRVSPFVTAGAGGGWSRPTVNDRFPDPVENGLRVLYVGGGVRVPVGDSFDIWGDARAMLGLEGYDSVIGLWPVRVGGAWRF